MKTYDRRMVDEPCNRKGFLENREIQQPTAHVFWWIVIFLYGFPQCLCFESTR